MFSGVMACFCGACGFLGVCVGLVWVLVWAKIMCISSLYRGLFEYAIYHLIAL